MAPTAPVGYLAASLVFATFCTKRMVPLRALAIASNIAFIGYGYLGELRPILILHAALLPMNILRLRQAVLLERPCDTTGRCPRAGENRRWPKLASRASLTWQLGALASGGPRPSSRRPRQLLGSGHCDPRRRRPGWVDSGQSAFERAPHESRRIRREGVEFGRER